MCTQIVKLHMKSIRSEVACNLILQYLGDENASEAERRAAELQRVITDFQRSEGDTGSSEVQGAGSSSVKGPYAMFFCTFACTGHKVVLQPLPAT